jgi:hypothetical protein
LGFPYSVEIDILDPLSRNMIMVHLDTLPDVPKCGPFHVQFKDGQVFRTATLPPGDVLDCPRKPGSVTHPDTVDSAPDELKPNPSIEDTRHVSTGCNMEICGAHVERVPHACKCTQPEHQKFFGILNCEK